MTSSIKFLLSLLFVFSVALVQASKVAVLNFKYNGPEGQKYLDGAVPEMLSTTFASSQKISLVERSQIKKLLGEMSLGQTGVVDPATAARIGKMAGAQRVVLGSIVVLGKTIRIDAKVVDVETSVVIPGAAARQKAKSIETLDVATDALAAALLKNLTGESKSQAPQGIPTEKAVFHLMVSKANALSNFGVDGKMLQSNDGSSAKMKLSHGEHIFEVYEGFSSEVAYTKKFTTPGGYDVRGRWDGKSLTIYGISVRPGLENKAKQTSSQASAKNANTANTTTNKTTTQGDGGSMKVTMKVPGMDGAFGVEMETNMGGMTTTETTTTYSSTTGETALAVREEPLPVHPMKASSFRSKLKTLKSEEFEHPRIDLAKSLFEGKNLSTKQVIQILKLFTYEDSKIDLAKAFFETVVDKDEYHTVMRVFEYSSSKDELREFMDQ